MPLRRRLDNGLTLIFEPRHAAHVATFQLWVNAGSADERPDQAGLAHLHEHMLFKGTKHRGVGQVAREIEAHGGDINAWTSFDETVYHATLASPSARAGLDVLADALRHSTFEAGELAREIEVVCEEIKRSEDTPSRRASREHFQLAFGDHPYARPVLGTAGSVRSYTRDKVLEFYKHHYAPQNIVLIAVGDLAASDVERWATESLGGDWGRPSANTNLRSRQSSRASGPRFQVLPDDVREAYWHLSFSAPAISHPDVPGLDVLALILGQGQASRLQLDVKRRRALVSSIGASAFTPKDPGAFFVSATLPAEKLAAATSAVAQALAQLCEVPVPADELAAAVALLESEQAYQAETVDGLARKLGLYETQMGGFENEARYHERVRQLTPAALRDIAQRTFDPERVLLTVLAPASDCPTSERMREAFEAGWKSPGAPVIGRTLSTAPVTAPLAATAPLARSKNGIAQARLSCGLTLIVRERRDVPLVAARVAFPGGVRLETPDTHGTSALWSRTLSRGSASHDAPALSRLWDEMSGGFIGAGGRNSAGARAEWLSDHFARGFELFAEQLLTPTFPDAEVERERALLLEDRRTLEDRPASLASELFARALYGDHPCGFPLSGDPRVLAMLDARALKTFQAQALSPRDGVLAVVGNVRAEEVFARADALFSSMGTANKPARTDPPSPKPPTRAQLLQHHLPREQAHLVLGFWGARVTDGWRHALAVMTAVLSGQGGRLFLELRDKQSLAYSVGALHADGVEPGHFEVRIGTSPAKQDVALSALRKQLMLLREAPPSPAELERAQRSLVGEHEISFQRGAVQATAFAIDACHGLGAEASLRFMDDIFAVTREQVHDVAQRVIQFEHAALALVGPTPLPEDVLKVA
ncbi:MAG: M16 family metallopeptidase [Myxococcaceae bacterium]